MTGSKHSQLSTISSPLKKGYKQTEVGVIPEDWDVCQLKQICSMKSGNTITNADISEHAKFPCYGGNGCRGYTSDFSHDGAFALIGRQGALCGNVVGVKGKFFASEHAVVVTGSLQTDVEWLTYVLGEMHLNQYAESSAQPGLSVSKLLVLSIPVPPNKAEQQAIATALSDMDDLIGSLEKLIAKKRAIKTGAMQQLLTGKQRLPGFEGEWETKRLGDVIDKFIGGGTPSRSEPRYWGHEIPWVTVKDFATFNPRQSQESITREGLVNSASHLIKKGTLITSTRMALGKAVIYEVDVAINQDLKALYPKACVSTKYLYYWFQYKADFIDDLGSGSTVKGISLPDLKKVEFLFPLLSEQQAIAKILSDMDTEIQALEKRLQKTKAIKQGMMQELLTGKTRLVHPVSIKSADKAEKKKSHNWQINEAVVISALVKHFGSIEYPLGRKRYTKLSYLLHRHEERIAEGYLKKAAGPYNPATKYSGPEKIAQKNGYIKRHKRDNFAGFIVADNIAQAEEYFEDWYGKDALIWLEQFRKRRNDDLELLTTVDMAMEDLQRSNKSVSLSTVKELIDSEPEWKPKLSRDVFSDFNIARAMKELAELLG